MKRLASTAGMAAILLTTPAYAADLAECAAITDDGKRLACYDALAKPAVPTAASQKERKETFIRDDIIDRCQIQMGSFGASMVKACVDQDLEGYEKLQELIPAHGQIVERCAGQMSSFGWSMVLACAEQDIEADRALKRMRN